MLCPSVCRRRGRPPLEGEDLGVGVEAEAGQGGDATQRHFGRELAPLACRVGRARHQRHSALGLSFGQAKTAVEQCNGSPGGPPIQLLLGRAGTALLRFARCARAQPPARLPSPIIQSHSPGLARKGSREKAGGRAGMRLAHGCNYDSRTLPLGRSFSNRAERTTRPTRSPSSSAERTMRPTILTSPTTVVATPLVRWIMR